MSVKSRRGFVETLRQARNFVAVLAAANILVRAVHYGDIVVYFKYRACWRCGVSVIHDRRHLAAVNGRSAAREIARPALEVSSCAKL